MESKAKLLGHPIHQMLIPFPLGLLATSVVFDVMHLATGRPTWAEVAFYLVAAGILSGAAAAIFGWIDWTGIPPRTRAKRVGLAHGVGNALVLLLFAGSWLIRRADPQNPATMAVVLSIAGALLSLVTAWLGGELVDRLGVGVEDGATSTPQALSQVDRRASASSAAVYSTTVRRVGPHLARGDRPTQYGVRNTASLTPAGGRQRGMAPREMRQQEVPWQETTIADSLRKRMEGRVAARGEEMAEATAASRRWTARSSDRSRARAAAPPTRRAPRTSGAPTRLARRDGEVAKP